MLSSHVPYLQSSLALPSPFLCFSVLCTFSSKKKYRLKIYKNRLKSSDTNLAVMRLMVNKKKVAKTY